MRQARRLLKIIVAILILAASSTATINPRILDNSRSVSTITREGRLAVFDDIWETIQQRYYDPNLHGVDWQSKRISYRPLAADASTSQEFYDIVRQMILSLKDPHTRVYAPEE